MHGSDIQPPMRNVISVKTDGGSVVTGQLLRFESRSGAFECFQANPLLSAGEQVCEARLEIAGAASLAGPIRIEEVVDTGLSCVCEFSVQGDLRPDEAGEPRGTLSGARGLNDCLDDWRASNLLLPRYKLLVGDMATIFGCLNDWLLSVEQSSAGESGMQDSALRARAVELGPRVAGAIDSVWEEFHAIADGISEGDSALYRNYLRNHLQHFLMASPFAWRSLTKPLGYAGDYECVNMIERDPYEGRSLFAMMVNYWLLQQLPSRAHRSRIDYLEQRLLDESARMAAVGRPLRVFNLGCGPAIEIQRFLRSHAISSKAEFTLLDFSRETLDYTSGVLGDLKSQWGRQTRLQYVESNVRKLLRNTSGARRQTTARYDLIYCAGLFDYLPDAVCAQLLEILYEWLEPGGLLLSTNVETTRAIELSLDYMLDWKLICRDQAQFERLVPRQAADDLVQTIGVDQGYNLFLEVRRSCK